MTSESRCTCSHNLYTPGQRNPVTAHDLRRAGAGGGMSVLSRLRVSDLLQRMRVDDFSRHPGLRR